MKKGLSYKQKSWQDDLFDIAEKYCQHDGGKMNNCLFWLIKPIIEKALQDQKEELELENIKLIEDTLKAKIIDWAKKNKLER